MPKSGHFITPLCFVLWDLCSTRQAGESAKCPVCCENCPSKYASPLLLGKYQNTNKEYTGLPFLSASPACHLLAIPFICCSCP